MARVRFSDLIKSELTPNDLPDNVAKRDVLNHIATQVVVSVLIVHGPHIYQILLVMGHDR